MGEHLWHRVSEHGQPPNGVDILHRLDNRYNPEVKIDFDGSTCHLGSSTEWCVVDLPTEYAPKLRNGWQPMSTLPASERESVLIAFESGSQGAYSVRWARTLSHAVAWMPLPAGPYDEPQGAPE